MKCSRVVSVVVVTFAVAACGGGPGEEPAADPAGEPERASELVQPSEWWSVHPRPVYATLEKVGTFQDWFDVYELTEGTFAIYEPNQFEEAISYLVLGGERGVLIDTGTGIGDIRAVVEQLTDLPVSVLNTHEHYDHVGGDYRFDEIVIFGNPDATGVLGRGRSNESLRGYVTDEYLWKPLPEGFDPATWTIPSVTPTATLQDGEIVDLGGRTLEVIYTPGHSPGSACLLDAENRLLFTGDHFFAGPLYAHADDVDIDLYVASNRKIAERVDEYDWVLGGHNDPWVPAGIIPRVSEAFDVIFAGGGEFSEGDGLRRYRFDGFDVLIRTEQVARRAGH